MKILIKDVKIGAKYEDKIYDYFIFGQLKNGLEIKIFDLNAYDLRKFKNHIVECLIQAFIIKNVNSITDGIHTRIKGKFLEYYIPSNDWIKNNNKINNKNWFGVQINGDVLLVNPNEFKDILLEKDEELSFDVVRFDLLAWHPI